MVSYDSSVQRYTLTNEERTCQFGPSELKKETSLPDVYPRVEYEILSSTSADYLVYFKSPNSEPPLVFEHAGHGAWQQNESISGGTRVRLDYFIYGEPTSTSEIPTSGTVTYRFFGTGNYADNDRLFVTDIPGTITVDFSAGTISANITPSGSEFFGGGVGGTTPFRIRSSFAGSSANGAGEFDVPTWAGRFHLQFYGPQAAEIGITFSAIGENGAQTGAVIGVRQ